MRVVSQEEALEEDDAVGKRRSAVDPPDGLAGALRSLACVRRDAQEERSGRDLREVGVPGRSVGDDRGRQPRLAAGRLAQSPGGPRSPAGAVVLVPLATATRGRRRSRGVLAGGTAGGVAAAGAVLRKVQAEPLDSAVRADALPVGQAGAQRQQRQQPGMEDTEGSAQGRHDFRRRPEVGTGSRFWFACQGRRRRPWGNRRRLSPTLLAPGVRHKTSGGRDHQLSSKFIPSDGLRARFQEYGDTAADTGRTLPSPSPTMMPLV